MSVVMMFNALMVQTAVRFARRSKNFVLSIIGVAAVFLAPIDAQSMTFRNWTVTCESDGYCRAETPDTTSPDLKKPNNILRIARNAASNAAWEISVETLEKSPALLGPAVFRIAGQRPFSLTPNREYTLAEKPNEFFLTAASSNQALFRRMIESRRVFVTLGQRSAEEVKSSFSLNGLSAALLWIDEKQRRIGSRRTVNLPIKRLAQDDTKPERESEGDAETLAYKLHDKSFNSDECDVTAAEAYAIGIAVTKLDNTTSLVQIPCFAAAYNTLFALYLVTDGDGKAQLLRWAIPSENRGWVVEKTLTNSHFDSQTGELSMIHKSRGLGDCGVFGRWRWIDGAFSMLEMRLKNQCNGVDDEWPLVFP